MVLANNGIIESYYLICDIEDFLCNAEINVTHNFSTADYCLIARDKHDVTAWAAFEHYVNAFTTRNPNTVRKSEENGIYSRPGNGNS